MVNILTAGDWGAHSVRTTWVASSRQQVPEVEKAIDETWRAAMERADLKLYDGPMCRLESWNANGDALELALSRTSYREFFGTNLKHADLADRFGRNVLANPVGLSGPLLTSDGFLMLGRRNAKVGYYPNRIHPFAGTLDHRDDGDLFAGMRRELTEEIGFRGSDVADIRCVGIVEDAALRQPEAVFLVRSNRNRREIERGVDAAEHLASWSIPATRPAMEAAIEDDRLTPVAVGAILLCGRAEFGDEWMR